MKRTFIFILGSVAVWALLAFSSAQPMSGALPAKEQSAASAAPQGLATTIVVTSTTDSGPSTLRQALLDAMSGDTITFEPAVFLPTSPVTIALASALPDITQGNLTIDASDAGVILDGSALSSGDGFHITSDGNVIKGMQILYFPGNGVRLDSGASYNLIGGSNAAPGGTCAGDCNLISGNSETGVGIEDMGTDGNIVIGNYIGTDMSGMTALGNNRGVNIRGGASDNVVGGPMEGESNIISGNNNNGLVIEGTGTTGNTVIGNYIGTDAGGETSLANAHRGVGIFWGAQQNTIGGTTPGEPNIISGNGDMGVGIEDMGTDGKAFPEK